MLKKLINKLIKIFLFFLDSIEPRKPGNSVRMYGPASRLPSLTQPVPKNWETVEGEFVMVQASYQTHIGSDCFIVPNAKLSDGIIWLMFVKKGASRSQMLQVYMIIIIIFIYFRNNSRINF